MITQAFSDVAAALRETQQSHDEPMAEAAWIEYPKRCALTRLLSAATDAEWNARARRTTPSNSHLERYAAAVAQKETTRKAGRNPNRSVVAKGGLVT